MAADDKPTPPTPAEKPEVDATEEKPETPKTESTPVTTKAEESPATEKKEANWVILSALIGLGVAAAIVAVLKKTV